MLGMGIGRSIRSQEEEKSDSGGDFRGEVGSSVFWFSFVVEPVEILFLVGGASGWSVPAAVAMVFGGRGSGDYFWRKRQWVPQEE